MKFRGTTKLLRVSVIAAAACALIASDAKAWYGYYGGYGCGYACCDPCVDYCCMTPGQMRRAARQARRAARACCAYAYCGCYDCCGCGCYDCCTTCCYTPCCDPCGCTVSYSYTEPCCGSTSYGVPVESGSVEPTPAEPAPAAPEEAILDSSAAINVTVPADAKVFVNGAATTSTGTSRQYVSRGLKPGLNYAYNFRVEYEVDGKQAVQYQTVKLTAGDNHALAFDFNATDAQIASLAK